MDINILLPHQTIFGGEDEDDALLDASVHLVTPGETITDDQQFMKCVKSLLTCVTDGPSYPKRIQMICVSVDIIFPLSFWNITMFLGGMGYTQKLRQHWYPL
jgi:hypothetical protein